jgi:hypothetical protein
MNEKDFQDVDDLFSKASNPVAGGDVFKDKIKKDFLFQTQMRRKRRNNRTSLLKVAAVLILIAALWPFHFWRQDLPRNTGISTDFSSNMLLFASEAKPLDYSLTVYNENLALVRDRRRVIDMPQGRVRLDFNEVSGKIIPESVTFLSLTHPRKVRVLEQNYLENLVTKKALLEKYINKEVLFSRRKGTWESGTLLSHEGGVALQTKEGLFLSHDGISLRFPALPEDFLTKPTLRWELANEIPGRQNCQVTYLTRGLSWHADHNLFLDDESGTCRLKSWVTVNNRSGASFINARFKFLAGDINRVRKKWLSMKSMNFESDLGGVKGENEGDPYKVEEKSFSEYHLYELPQALDLPDRAQKQIEFINRRDIYFTRKYYLTVELPRYPLPDNRTNFSKTEAHFNQIIEIENKKSNQMGLPFPEGKIRVFKKHEGEDYFIASQMVKASARGEKVSLNLGPSFNTPVHIKWMKIGNKKAFLSARGEITLNYQGAREEEFIILFPELDENDFLQVEGFPCEVKNTDAGKKVRLKLKSASKITLKIDLENER